MRKKIAVSVLMLGALVILGAGCSKQWLPSSKEQPVQPAIVVKDQDIKDGQVVIKDASIGDDGWIVIHTKQNGQLGPIIGYTSLSAGTASKIKVSINKTDISPSLIAALYYDRGEKGVFEPSAGDGPVIKDQQMIIKEFNITNYADITKESASDKPIGDRKEFIVTAKQWSFSPSEIKVKKGDRIVLKIKSADVAHGFAIAELGISAAINPGETTIVEFTADKVGTFTFFCNVYCGVGHIGMKGTLIVEE